MTGDELRQARLELGLTQVQLAKMLGYHSKHLSKLETGLHPITQLCAMAVETLVKASMKGHKKKSTISSNILV